MLEDVYSWCKQDSLYFISIANQIHLGQGNPKHRYGLGGEWFESSPGKKDLGVLGKKTWHDLAMSTHSPGQMCPGLHPKYCGQQGRDHKDDQRGGVTLLWRQAEKIGIVLPEEEKALGRNYHSIQ